MKLLNLCCGAVRPQTEEWINVDNLHATILPGTPERENLDRETNYQNLDVEQGLPLGMDWADGILMSHCLEHWDCQTGARVMSDCWKILKPGGILLVSVPDASYFRRVYDRDTVENAVELFGEPIHLPDGEQTFFGYGLWNRWHKAILTEDALWAYFVRAGFRKCGKVEISTDKLSDPAWFASSGTQTNFKFPEELRRWIDDHHEVLMHIVKHLNRLPFSLVMVGVKS